MPSTAGEMATTGVCKFDVGDKLYCYFENLLYVSKCLNRRISNDGKVEYYIHYVGWDKKWDEWVDEERILVINDVNKALKKTLEYQSGRRRRNNSRNKDISNESETGEHLVTQTSMKKDHTPGTENTKVAKFMPGSKAASSNAQSNENAVALCSSIPLKSIKMPRFDMEKSGIVSIIQFTGSNADTNVLQTNVTEKQSSTLESDIDKSSCSRVDTNRDALKHTFSAYIVEQFGLTFSLSAGMASPRIRMPDVISEEVTNDWLSINSYNKILKFPYEFTAGDMVNDFIESQKSLNTIAGERAHLYGVTLLNLFNSVVHDQLLYENEKDYDFQNKGLCYYIQRSRVDKSKVGVLRELLHHKKVWCYVYSPVHLMRLFTNLSSRVTPKDDSELVVIAGSKIFLEFVENNVDKYFADRSYICITDSDTSLRFYLSWSYPE